MREYRSGWGMAESCACCPARETNSITPALSDINEKAQIHIPPALTGPTQPQPKQSQHHDLFNLDIVHWPHHLSSGPLDTPAT